MDTNLTKVVICKAEEAEFKIRSLAAQGYTLTHMAATQASGIMSTVTTVLVFGRSKQDAIEAAGPLPEHITKRQGKK